MPLGERVTSYTIAELKNEVVNYQQVVKFTMESGHQVFIAFPDQPPTQWLTVTGTNTTAFLERGEFDRVPHLLQTETPLFFSSLIFEGLRAFNLSTGPELPGEGPADDDALVQLMATIRQHLADSGEPSSG
ncbi:MAG TPA: hypothetical protein VGC06_21710 [Actinomycetes bacterium]